MLIPIAIKEFKEHRLMRKSGFFLTMASGLICSSCNGNKLYPVSGKVTLQGVPATGAAVFFRRQGADPMNEPMIMGVVEDDGSFEVVTGSLGKGAPPGEYDVLVEWKRVTGKGKRPQAGPDLLHGRYADPQRPRLHATVEERANELPIFEVTDAEANNSRPPIGGRR
jgi:hypothetical protein